MRNRVAVSNALSKAAVSSAAVAGALSLALLAGCEDGSDQVLFPLQGKVPVTATPPPQPDVFVAGDTKGFGDGVTDDEVGRAKFCGETEETALAEEMVVKPIIPDVSAGGLPLWAPN